MPSSLYQRLRWPNYNKQKKSYLIKLIGETRSETQIKFNHNT